MIGDSHHRIGGDRLASGAGRFVDDVRVPGHAARRRAALAARARAPGLDRRQARARAARRAAVLTAADVPGRRDHPQPRAGARPAPTATCSRPSPATSSATWASPWRWSSPTIRYVAADALERIDVVYEPLPACASVADALAPGAPRLFRRHRLEQRRDDHRCASATPTAALGRRRRGRPRALRLSAPDGGGAGDARPRRRAARPARRRAAPDRLHQVHPHQPHDPGADLRHPAGRAAPHRGRRGRRLRRARRAVSRKTSWSRSPR